MKKKQFMSKLAALTMAAMMGLSAVPAGAINVFAATPAVIVDTTGVTTDLTEADSDVSSAKSVTTGSLTLASITDDASAKTAIEGLSIRTTINSTSVTATIAGVKYTAATADTNGSIEGTATFKYEPADKTGATDTWYDETITVPFKATWENGDASATLSADGTASGTKTTYKNYTDSQVSSTDYVTVTKANASGKASTAADIREALVPTGGAYIDGSVYWDDDTNNWKSTQSGATVKIAIDRYLTGKAAGYEVDKDSVKFTDSRHFTFNVFKTSNASEYYTVTIAVEAVKIPDAVKTALDNFFNVHQFKISKDQTITNGTVASAVTNAENPSKDTANEWPDTIGTSDVVIYGNTTALTVADGKATGKLSVTVKSGNYGFTADKTFDYTFTANVDQSDSTVSETDAAAIAKINATVYPSYNTSANHTLKDVEDKIVKDLKDAGYSQTITTTPWSEADYDTATSTTDGYLKAAIGSLNAINVKLGYSSDQKSADTNKSVLNILKGTKSAATEGRQVTEHKVVTDGTQESAPADTVTLKNAKDFTIDIAATSKLSTTVQAATATKEATKAQVVAAVQKAIDDQLTADGVKDNGVTVTVKAVNTYDSSSKNVVDGHTAAATGAYAGNATGQGKWTLLVTTSIANDFNGYGSDTTAKTEVNYLVTLNTNKLKKSDATDISLADKTANITSNYKKSGDSKYTYTYVEVSPVLTPADANSDVTYKVVDSDGNVVVSNAASGSIIDVESASASTPIDLYKEGSTSKVSVSDNALGIAVTKAGTYKVTATANGHSATATVTVNDNFKDVPSTAYFSNAVKWAYKEGITAGTTETTFGSYDNVTRAQFVTWLYKYAVSKDASVEIADSDVKSVFSDVAADKYYAKAVQWAVASNVTAGTTATTFSPDQKITRAQALTMLWRAMGSPTVGVGQEDERTLKFTDLPTNAAFRTAMVWAIHESITSGTTPTTCSPDNICPRSQAVTFIYGANKWANK